MALSLSVSVTQLADCSTMAITDNTGAYNSITNPGGYNGANFALADLLSAGFDITLPNGTTVAVELTLPTLTIPEVTGLVSHYVTAEDLGLGTGASLPDGYYQITYRMVFTDPSVAAGETYVDTTTSCYFFCSVKCCVDKLVSAASFETCCTSPKDFMTLVQAYIMMKGLKNAIACVKVNKANKILGQLQKLCIANSCNC